MFHSKIISRLLIIKHDRFLLCEYWVRLYYKTSMVVPIIKFQSCDTGVEIFFENQLLEVERLLSSKHSIGHAAS